MEAISSELLPRTRMLLQPRPSASLRDSFSLLLIDFPRRTVLLPDAYLQDTSWLPNPIPCPSVLELEIKAWQFKLNDGSLFISEKAFRPLTNLGLNLYLLGTSPSSLLSSLSLNIIWARTIFEHTVFILQESAWVSVFPCQSGLLYDILLSSYQTPLTHRIDPYSGIRLQLDISRPTQLENLATYQIAGYLHYPA